MRTLRPSSAFAALFMAVMIIASCGGSDSPPAGPTTTTISGSAFAAPIAGATVVVLDSTGTTTIAGPVTTGSDGTYSVSLPLSELTSTLIITATSGTFIDEATGASTPAKELAAYVTGGSLSAGGSVHLDPSSTIIARLVRDYGRTHADAKAAFIAAFGYAPDLSTPPLNAPSSSATAAQRLAALRAMAFSQLTKDMGLNPDMQFDLIAALADDLADDGTVNGSTLVTAGSTTIPEDILNRMGRSIVSCMTNTAMNLTGLTTAEVGTLPFGKIALTNSYKVEYVPDDMMPASQGKTSFTIKILNRSDGLPASGLSLALMPKMYMATMSHMTPVGAVTDNGGGTYTCTVYYLMASGPGMGYWELKAQIGGMGGETAIFYPAVSMAMATNTVRTTLKGQFDIISTMTGTEKRSYYLFRDGLSGTSGNHTFDLFIAAKESMMSYPAVSGGSILTSPTGTWSVNPATTSLTASTDLSSWVTGTDNGGGRWTVSGLTGLATGTTGTIYVKLNVNTEDKTTDGNAASGVNAYSTFKVTL
ncbi:MAG: hypothetical protein ACYC7L_10985 [Nitrospirota bacterium]